MHTFNIQAPVARKRIVSQHGTMFSVDVRPDDTFSLLPRCLCCREFLQVCECPSPMLTLPESTPDAADDAEAVEVP